MCIVYATCTLIDIDEWICVTKINFHEIRSEESDVAFNYWEIFWLVYRDGELLYRMVIP